MESTSTTLPANAIRALTTAVTHLVAIVAMFSASSALAQTPTILENGPHHRVVEHTIQVRDTSGQLVPENHRYTEMATGLNYWDEKARAWVESQETFEITPDGYAFAWRGPHQVTIAPNINSMGAVRLRMPDDAKGSVLDNGHSLNVLRRYSKWFT